MYFYIDHHVSLYPDIVLVHANNTGTNMGQICSIYTANVHCSTLPEINSMLIVPTHLTL